MSSCVFSCRTKNKSSFSVPNDPITLKIWEKSLGIPLKTKSRVCEIHFEPENIITEWVSGQGCSKYTICLKRPKLKKGAVPKKPFNDCIESPPDSSDTFTKKRKSISYDYVKHDHSYFLSGPRKINTPPCPLSDTNKSCTDNSEMLYSIASSSTDSKLNLSPKTTQPLSSKIDTSTELFEFILKNNSLINVPLGWFIDVSHQYGHFGEMFICFHKLSKFGDNFVRTLEKQLVLTKDLHIFLHVNGKAINVSDIGIQDDLKLNSIEKIENIIKLFNQIRVCSGSGSIDKYPNVKSTFGLQFIESNRQWRHPKCTIILKSNESADTLCVWCKKLLYNIKNKQN